MCDVVQNRLFQFGHTTEDAVANAVLGDVAEPAFDHIQPRTAVGREVDVKAPMSLQPLPGVGILVRGVVIDDQMQVQVRQRLGIDLLQEPDPLLMPMLWQAFRDDSTLRQFDGREQRGRAVAFVVVRQRLESAGEQRQALLRPVEGLDLTLLIARQRQRVLGRIEVQPTTSTRLSANRGSFETLNDFTRCGFSPLSRQMR